MTTCLIYVPSQVNSLTHEDSVSAGSPEGFDFQILFDPFEEEFHLPSCFIDLRYFMSRQIPDIG